MDQSPSDSAWEQIAPFLDEAMATLGDQDRNAIVLRYFEQKPLADVGRALGVDADAAQKRVARAVDKLRKFLVKRGLVLSAAVLAGVLGANAVQAAPAALPAAITAVATVKGTAAAASTTTLIKGTLKIMAWTKLKTTVVIGACTLLAAGTATVVVKKNFRHRSRISRGKPLSAWVELLFRATDLTVPHGFTTETERLDARRSAEEAITQMGTNSLPFLVATLDPKPGALRMKLFKSNKNSALAEAGPAPMRYAQHSKALRETAKPAIPEV